MEANMSELRSINEALKGNKPQVFFNRNLRHKQIYTSNDENDKQGTDSEKIARHIHKEFIKESPINLEERKPAGYHLLKTLAPTNDKNNP
jgi:hypothetical protein